MADLRAVAAKNNTRPTVYTSHSAGFAGGRIRYSTFLFSFFLDFSVRLRIINALWKRARAPSFPFCFLVEKFQKRKEKMVCELDLGENGFLTCCFCISFRTNAKSDIIRPLMRHV